METTGLAIGGAAVSIIPGVIVFIKAWLSALTRQADSKWTDGKSVAPADTLRTKRSKVKAMLNQTISGRLMPNGVLDNIVKKSEPKE